MTAVAASATSEGPARRVLVVDDDRDFAGGLRNFLTLEGYEVETAYNAAQAIDAIEHFDAEVAILDYRLGPTVGLDLVSPLNERRAGIDCILSTAYADMDSVVGALRHHVYDYLSKPLRTDDLLATLERCFEKRRLEAEARAAQAALREAGKMEAVAQIAGGVAHHFNNLLTVIQGNLELVDTSALGDTEQSEFIDAALRAVEAAAEINRGLVAFTRHQVLRPEPVDANALITAVTDDVLGALPSAVRLRVKAAPGLWPVSIDRGRLRVAILHLARNAEEAMPRGGTLLIAAENVDHASGGEVFGCSLAAGRYVMIALADTGAGMPPEIAERVFEPFFTSRGMAEKAGLGLSVVYGFVKQSGGGVAIETSAGEGTTVRLFLPAIARPAGEQPE